jgi:hypothetical protein
MKKPYLVIHPVGGRRVADFAFKHSDGGACFLDVGWYDTTRNPFHVVDGPGTLADGVWTFPDTTTIQELPPGDPLGEEWGNWMDFKNSLDGSGATDERALLGCQSNGAIISEPL